MSVPTVQVENMNYLAGMKCSAWKVAVSIVRIDGGRQERDETDSSSRSSSIHSLIHPSNPTSLLPPFLPSLLPKILGLLLGELTVFIVADDASWLNIKYSLKATDVSLSGVEYELVRETGRSEGIF